MTVKNLTLLSALFLIAASLLVVSVLTAGPVTASAGAEEKMMDKPDYDITRVTDNIYSFRWKVHRNIFIVTPEGVIATDPISPDAASVLAAEIRKVTEQPVRYVVYSHEHWDHVLGGRIFKDMGATFVSHAASVPHFERSPHPDLVTPDVTFEGASYDLELGGRTLELHHFGSAHGAGMLVMRLPEERLLFTVDLVTPEAVGFRILPDYSPVGLIQTLKTIEETLEFDRILPGHLNQAVAPASAVRQERQYYEDLMAAVKTLMDEGVHEPGELARRVKLPRYSDWHGYEEWLPLSVERVWAYYHMGW